MQFTYKQNHIPQIDTNFNDSSNLDFNSNSVTPSSSSTFNSPTNLKSPNSNLINSNNRNNNQSHILPNKPDLSTKPSSSIIRKGSQYISNSFPTSTLSPNILPKFFPPSISDSLIIESNTSHSSSPKEIHSQQPNGHLLLHMSIKSILNLKNSSSEINSPDIFTTFYENRIVLTSSLNLGLKMILNPS